MFYVTINGNEYTALPNQTILNIAQREGIFIPTLCDDFRVEASGACGLCLVETEGTSKPVRACATVAQPGMVIDTDTPRLRSAQKQILELLLSAHEGDCIAPCRMACPAQTDCRQYISLIKEGKHHEAVTQMYEAHPFPASVARICPAPCEKNCTRTTKDEAINIAGLKRYACEILLNEQKMFDLQPSTFDFSPSIGNLPPSTVNPLPSTLSPLTGKSVAIVGGGPAGLTAAYFLRRAGHTITVYDRYPLMGGLLRYGIPEYRLPKKILDAELSVLEQIGIVFKNNIKLSDVDSPAHSTGYSLSLATLRAENDAVTIAIGASNPKPLDCPGDNLPGVYGGTTFLQLTAMGYISKERLPQLKRVVVIGGSNTAMDAARTALRLGAGEVVVAYRRTRAEMPAEPQEIAEAEAEGVIFKFLAAPIEITMEEIKIEEHPADCVNPMTTDYDNPVITDSLNPVATDSTLFRASGVRLQQMTLGDPDESGRRSPVPVPGAEEWLEADMIISAIGQIIDAQGLKPLQLTRWGEIIKADPDTFATNLPGVYAIGDATGLSAYAVEAIAHGKKAAAAIHEHLTATPLPIKILPKILSKVNHTGNLTKSNNNDHTPRQTVTPQPFSQSINNWDEIHPALSPGQAAKEASRCLSCGCSGFDKCKLIFLTNQLNANPDKFKTKPQKIKPSNFHDPAKCILCGLCVRACEKRNGDGQSLLYPAHRGIRTVINTDLLNSAACKNCTDCKDICPTGAMDGQAFKKVLAFTR